MRKGMQERGKNEIASLILSVQRGTTRIDRNPTPLFVSGNFESSRGFGSLTSQRVNFIVTAELTAHQSLARLTSEVSSFMAGDLRSLISSLTSKNYLKKPQNYPHVTEGLSFCSPLTLVDSNKHNSYHATVCLSHYGSLLTLEGILYQELNQVTNRLNLTISCLTLNKKLLIILSYPYLFHLDSLISSESGWVDRSVGASVGVSTAGPVCRSYRLRWLVRLSSVAPVLSRVLVSSSEVITWIRINWINYTKTQSTLQQQTTNQQNIYFKQEEQEEFENNNVIKTVVIAADTLVNDIETKSEPASITILSCFYPVRAAPRISQRRIGKTSHPNNYTSIFAPRPLQMPKDPRSTGTCSKDTTEFSFNPPSFQKFPCAMERHEDSKMSNTNVAPSPEAPELSESIPKQLKNEDSDKHVQSLPRRGATDGNWAEEIDACDKPGDNPDQGLEPELDQQNLSVEPNELPTKDITARSSDTRSEPSSPHVCMHKSLSATGISVSRHDKRSSGEGADIPSDELPGSEEESQVIQDLEDQDGQDDEPGVIRDPENEGDLELLKKASGTSNLTGDIDLLRPGCSPVEDTEKQIIEATKQPEKKNDTVNNNPNEANTDEDSKDEEYWTRMDQERQDRCMQEHDEFYRLEDERLAKYPSKKPNNGSSTSYDPMSTEDEGGRAGLDPDHSAMWGPEYIDVDVNSSKSKKRRRRQKATKEKLKKNDSLGRLLDGKQTKEEEQLISTYDYGNLKESKKRNLNTSGFQGGNLFQKNRTEVKDCGEEDDFVASLNSTQHGDDFTSDDSNSHSMLREGSEKEESMKDDVKDKEEPDVLDMSNEGIEDNMGKEEDKNEQDNDSSSNSTGAKRKRKRGKKNPNKTGHDPTPSAHAQEPSGRETRSKKLGKTGTQAEEALKNRDKDEENQKGEKEKHPEENQQVAVAQDGQVELFKRPTCSRSDIRRLVAKAVHKSKNKLSNNFAINSKIEFFRIVTDSTTVKKIPHIDDKAPLVELHIPEFIWTSPEKTNEEENMVSVKSRGVVQFIILARPSFSSTESWDTPNIDKVRDFASYLTCQIAENKLDFSTILRWTNPWGNVAVMGLDTSNLDLLMKFRIFLNTLSYAHQNFNTFPKDAITDNLGISILLRSDLREFQEKHLAEALFARNDLSGILETVQAETFTASDRTRAGVSKNGWRSVLMEGDEEFLKSLGKFTAMHWFNIGPASVQIHGGDRRAETAEEIEAKSKRRRFNMPIGHSLTETAKSSINKSYREDQEALRRNLIVPPRQAQQSGANRAPPGRKKK